MLFTITNKYCNKRLTDKIKTSVDIYIYIFDLSLSIIKGYTNIKAIT